MAKKTKINRPRVICLDTNILLSYFEGDIPLKDLPSRIEALKELKKLVDQEKVDILIPEQVIDEYERQKNKKINRRVMQLDDLKPNCNYNKDAMFEEQVKESDEKIKKVEEELLKNVKIFSKNLKDNIKTAEKLINELINGKGSKILTTDKNILQGAIERVQKGNPPFESKKRKNNEEDDVYKYEGKHGDAIIWETLLQKSPEKKITVITNDGGWYEDADSKGTGKKEISYFLSVEWKKRGYNEIKALSSLSDFVNEISQKQIVKKEVVEKERDIASVSASNFFSQPTLVGGASYASQIFPDLFTGVAYNPDLATYTFGNKRRECPYNDCKKDITSEVESFVRTAYLNQLSSIGFGYSNSSLQCPYCKRKIL